MGDDSILTHLPSHGGGTVGGQTKRKNPGFGGGSGRPRAAGKPLKHLEGEAPHVCEGFPGRPGPPRPPKSKIYLLWLWPGAGLSRGPARGCAAGWPREIDFCGLNGPTPVQNPRRRGAWRWACWVFKIARFLDRKTSISGLNDLNLSKPKQTGGLETGLLGFRNSAMFWTEGGRFLCSRRP